jgi:RNA polymerase sigma-70 factor, ECF subfamily
MPGLNAQVTDDGVGPDGDRDAALVRRVLDGDATAFTTLVDRHASACLRFATRMLGNRADAEDATQETLVRAYRALGRYEEREVFRTWLFAILVNRCRTAAMRRERRQRRVVADEHALVSAAVASDAGAVEWQTELERALATLDPEQREAFVLKHVEQWSYDEMAAATGVGVSALKMRVKRACERLQLLMAEVRDERR